MTTYAMSREVRIPRQRGLMARSLQLSSDSPLQLSGRFDSRDADLDKPSSPPQSAPVNGVRHYVSEYRDTTPSNGLITDDVFVTSKTEHVASVARENLKVLSAHKITLSSATTCVSPTSDVPKRHRLSRQSSIDSPLKPIQENESDEGVCLSSTQHLRTGFFRSIKRQYPSLGFEGLGIADVSSDSGHGDSLNSVGSSTQLCEELESSSSDVKSTNGRAEEEEEPFMSSMARRRLRDLRKVDPTKVDVATGLQWIRLELHEMREQDKALFLQLIKLHSTIKEIRTEMNCIEHDSDGSYDDINDAASLWWPRCNSASMLPDFSSSDGAQLIRRSRTTVRRGTSFTHHRPSRFNFPSNLSGLESMRSLSSSASSS